MDCDSTVENEKKERARENLLSVGQELQEACELGKGSCTKLLTGKYEEQAQDSERERDVKDRKKFHLLGTTTLSHSHKEPLATVLGGPRQERLSLSLSLSLFFLLSPI